MQDLRLPVQGTGSRRNGRFGATTAFPTPDPGVQLRPSRTHTTHTGLC